MTKNIFWKNVQSALSTEKKYAILIMYSRDLALQNSKIPHKPEAMWKIWASLRPGSHIGFMRPGAALIGMN